MWLWCHSLPYCVSRLDICNLGSPICDSFGIGTCCTVSRCFTSRAAWEKIYACGLLSTVLRGAESSNTPLAPCQQLNSATLPPPVPQHPVLKGNIAVSKNIAEWKIWEVRSQNICLSTQQWTGDECPCLPSHFLQGQPNLLRGQVLCFGHQRHVVDSVVWRQVVIRS